jgi:hypothetical protein
MKGVVGERSGKLFDLLPCRPYCGEGIVKDESIHCYRNCWFLRNSFPEEFIRVFLYTKLSFWLPIIARLSIQERYGITVTENTVVVYGSKEPVKLPFSDREVGQRLQDYFFNWPDKSLEGENELCSE